MSNLTAPISNMLSSDPSNNKRKKRYALVGTGGRASFFYSAITSKYAATSVLVGLCDTNQTRLDYANSRLPYNIPTYKATDFDYMISETDPDEVIITTIDRTHHTYIIRALELGKSVITEKPMTIDVPRCLSIFSAVNHASTSFPEKKPKVRVTFNYRYAPHNTKIYQLLSTGAIGTVTSVHFEWMLNTSHGADYFRRWHRDKRNSGGLLVHKSTHHFDLVNFWLQTTPLSVYATGDLRFYGKENAESRGITRSKSRTYGTKPSSEDGEEAKFDLDMEKMPALKEMYLAAEHEDGYYRDQSVFGDGISIEDTMSLLVRYKSGAAMTYSLTAYAPWEGFRVSFNGTGGRLEVEIVENSYVNSGGEQGEEGKLEKRKIVLRKLFEKPVEVEIEDSEGAHGGGDEVLLEDLFGQGAGGESGDSEGKGLKVDEYRRAASHVDGAASILTGIAANRSIATGKVVFVDDLLKLPES
ncbi:putative oxidoreductase [Rhypophila decipiens]